MSEPKNILNKVRDRVEECFKKAEAYYGEKIPRCQIAFDLTGTTAGTANYGKRLLRFNRKLLVDNEEHFMVDTCPHEVAHIVQFWKHWSTNTDLEPHGNEWKFIMVKVFGIPPKRCHRLDTSKVKRKTKQYRYTCECPGKNFMFGLIKHKKAQKGNQYACPRCMKTLSFEGKGEIKKPTGLIETEL